MNCKLFILVQVLVLSTFLVEGDDSIWNANEGFTRIGRAKNHVANPTTGDVSIQDSMYMIFIDEVGWTEVEAKCQAYDGPDATMVYIETIEEFDLLNTYLSERQFTDLFWVGGEWNTTGQAFQWGNGVFFGPELDSKWDTGYPDAPTENTKIMVHNELQMENLKFRTGLSDERHKSVCELNLGDWACRVDNDLVIIIDATTSLGATNFRRTVDFVHDIADAWLAHDANRLSFIVFGTIAEKHLSLNNTLTDEEIQTAIERAFYHAAFFSNIHLALTMAFNEFETHPGSNLKNVILVTDGGSTSPLLTRQAAEKLRDAGTEIFVLGVGEEADHTELLEITGDKPENAFGIAEFTHFNWMLRPMKETIC